MADNHGRLCRNQSLEPGKADQNHGKEDFKNQKRDNRNQRIGNRNILIGDGQGGNLGNQKRCDKIGDLQFADLPLAHDPKREEQGAVNQ